MFENMLEGANRLSLGVPTLFVEGLLEALVLL